MVLVQKWPFLQLFLRRYRPEKCVLRYSRTKKRFSTPLEQEDKPSQDSYKIPVVILRKILAKIVIKIPIANLARNFGKIPLVNLAKTVTKIAVVIDHFLVVD